MAKNITQKDIEYLNDVIALQTNRHNYKGFVIHGEYGKARFERIKELKLIEHVKIDGTDRYGWKPSEAGQKLIAPFVEERARRQAEDIAQAEKLKADDELRQVKKAEIIEELTKLGVTNISQCDTAYYPDDGDYSVKLKFIRVSHSHFPDDKTYDRVGLYVLDIVTTGRITADALIEEAKQAQIACDLLNSKLAEE